MRRSIHLVTATLVTAAMGIIVPMANAQCVSDGSGDAIQCRMGNVLSKNSTLLSGLQTQVSSCDSTDAHCVALQRHLDRAIKAHNRAVNAHKNTSSDDYHQLTLSPTYHRNSNRKGGGGVTATASAPDTVDTNYDPTVGQSISDSLDDTGSALDDANVNLASIPAPTPPTWPEVAPYYFNRASDEDAYPAWLHPTIDEKVWIPALFSIKLAVGALEVAQTAAEHACNETLVAIGEGGNASLACLPLALTLDALSATAEMMEFADRDLLYWNAKGGYVNAQRAVTGVNAAGQTITTAAGDIEAVKAKVDGIALYIDNTLNPDVNKILANQATILANQATIIKLLLTPQGQRPGFPVK